MSKLLLMDTETGGLKKTETILTLYMGIVDPQSLLIEEELYLEIKPDDGNYIYSEEALKVNGIDLKKHDKTAITESQAAEKIITLLSRVSRQSGKVTPLGHNVVFDIDFINNKLVEPRIWNQYVSDKTEDTMLIGKRLKERRLMPEVLPNSLGSYAEFFFIRTSDLHNAQVDCYVTLKVYKKLIELGHKVVL